LTLWTKRTKKKQNGDGECYFGYIEHSSVFPSFFIKKNKNQ